MFWKVLFFFVLFGFIGSFIMDSDHAIIFVEHPGLLKQANTQDSYWKVADNTDSRRLHIPILVFSGMVTMMALMFEQEQKGGKKDDW